VTETLSINAIGHRGDGVVEIAQGLVFVPYALPGEAVTVEGVAGHPERRHLLRVERTSAERTEPICPHFGVCGGCALQHWAAAPYLAWKRQLVIDALAQAGLTADVHATVDAHGDGRRRVVLHAREGTHDMLNVGFSAPRAHHLVPIDHCPIVVPALQRAIPVAWALATALKPTRKPLDIHVTATDSGLDVDLRGSGPLAPERQSELVRLASELRLARLTRHGDLVGQTQQPTIRMGAATVPLPPGAFLQATAAGEEALAQLVLRHVGRVKQVADLFAGVGPFALRLAASARVTAIDSHAPAIEALRRGAASASGLRPIAAAVRDLFRSPLSAAELKAFDSVVFDPPRQGAEAQAREIARSRVPTVVAVSCNPTTFARDARILVDGGYRLAEVTPIDQFRYSAHVELVAEFRH
jgi:23S rRNA (uracil1939-C5)-methyltransferase